MTEYLSVIGKLLEEQYGTYSSEDYKIYDIKEEKTISNGVLDVSKANITDLQQQIYKYKNFKIEKFILKILKINENKFDITIFEEISKSRLNKVKILFDSRFELTDWTTFFDRNNQGSNIPVKELISIIRWLQAISRLKAFI